MRHYKIEYRIYADDTQLYLSFDVDYPYEALHAIHNCMSDIQSWMIGNKLYINDDKTEFLSLPHQKLNFLQTSI